MSIQTSIGTPTATSYISVASATEYFNTRESSEEWLDMGTTGTLGSTARRENLLKQSARELDRTYRFMSSKYNQGTRNADDFQNLEFPRNYNTDNDGDLYIPFEVQNAQCEQALYIMQRGATRYSQEANSINTPFISEDAYSYLKLHITRQVVPVGKPSWK